MTPDELTDRTRRAVAAAVAAGRHLGLEVTEPRVLHDVFSVVVHLAPSPVVVRVPTVLPRCTRADPAGQRRQQQRELDVAAWLAARGHPVVTPSPLVPREPVAAGAFSTTFWTWAEQRPGAEPSETDTAVLAARLHAALADCPVELALFAGLEEFVSDGLAQLVERPDLLGAADLERATAEWAVLAPLVRSPDALRSRFPDAVVQPVHGDAPTYNVIVTPDGALSSDFELVGLGPVEGDLALLTPEALAAYDAEARRCGRPPHDPRLLRVLEAVRLLQLVVCLAQVPELPLLREGLAPGLDQWRASPFAGGLDRGPS